MKAHHPYCSWLCRFGRLGQLRHHSKRLHRQSFALPEKILVSTKWPFPKVLRVLFYCRSLAKTYGVRNSFKVLAAPKCTENRETWVVLGLHSLQSSFVFQKNVLEITSCWTFGRMLSFCETPTDKREKTSEGGRYILSLYSLKGVIVFVFTPVSRFMVLDKLALANNIVNKEVWSFIFLSRLVFSAHSFTVYHDAAASMW